MFSLASSKLGREKNMKNNQSQSCHQPEFQLKLRRGNESETQEVPIWIPLSIMAEGAAIATGVSINNAQIASSVIIGHGNVVANRYHNHRQRDSSLSIRKADAFGEIIMAAKISALSLLRGGESVKSSKAVEDAVLGWGGFLFTYVYANKVITLDIDGIAEEGGNDDEHNPLWQASLDAASRDDYSDMTIPSGVSQPQTSLKNKPIVDYYKTNVGNIPIIGNDIYLVKDVQNGERKIISLQEEEGRVSLTLTDRISSALFNDGQLVKDVLSWEDKNEVTDNPSNGDDEQKQYINGGILSPPTRFNNNNDNKPTRRKVGSKHLSKKEMVGISAMALLLQEV